MAEHTNPNCNDEAFEGLVACVDGRIYGPCEFEECGGICEFVGECDCACHR